jgi:hypothetical protein
MTPEKLAMFDKLVGSTLQELGYPLAKSGDGGNLIGAMTMRASYASYFDAKFWFKNSAFGRAYLGPLSGEQIDNTVIATDPATQPAPTR